MSKNTFLEVYTPATKMLEQLANSTNHYILRCNPHNGDYMSVEDFIKEQEEDNLYDIIDKQEMIDKNTIWTIKVHEATPIGFYALAGSSLDVILRKVAEG